MSVWMHVAAIVRIDSRAGFRSDNDFGLQDYMDYFGKECPFDAPEEVWKDMENNPDDYLPSSSEGTLRIMGWENPDESCTDRYTISIFGDLRNKYDIGAIIAWFRRKCGGLHKRQAVITVEDDIGAHATWAWDLNDPYEFDEG